MSLQCTCPYPVPPNEGHHPDCPWHPAAVAKRRPMDDDERRATASMLIWCAAYGAGFAKLTSGRACTAEDLALAASLAEATAYEAIEQFQRSDARPAFEGAQLFVLKGRD